MKYEELKELRSRLLQGEPVQYVVGVAEFCGRSFHVEPGVLIPRPETADLCQWIIRKETGERRKEKGERRKEERESILDIGTGSGCIAVTLASELPESKVTAWDISDDALRIAQQNARRNNVHVTFEQRDILSHPSSLIPHPSSKWSTIVSNPPYICPSEQTAMDRNVLTYEPHLALFVPEEEPLLFYQAISRYARHTLHPGGSLYFEANPLYMEALQVLLRQEGFTDIIVRDDQFGKHRFIMGRKGI